jgi:pilus assembly protein CpaC
MGRTVNRKKFWFALVWAAGGFPFSAHALSARNEKPLEVQVEITEVDHLKAASLGMEWPAQIGVEEVLPPTGVALGDFHRVTPLTMNLHALVQEGAAEILANPNLITDSGTVATFHAGGEIPYITSSSLGTTNVEFKTYGVGLKIQPTRQADQTIHLKVDASISAPDETNGVTLSGNSVPALLNRRVTSEVTMNSGTTLTLAGLIQTRKEETEAGVPFLRRVPVLGVFFRWKKTGFRRTTIVIFVTPRITT